MSNWITLTKADLYDTKVAALVDQVDAISLGAGQTERTTDLIAAVTAEIRRKCAHTTALDADLTKSPGGLKTLALDLIACRIKSALEMELNQDERNLLLARERDLNRIADGKDLVDLPDNPVAVSQTMQSGGSAQIVSQKTRLATRERLDGLM